MKLWRILKNTKIQARITSIDPTLSKRYKITHSKKKKLAIQRDSYNAL